MIDSFIVRQQIMEPDHNYSYAQDVFEYGAAVDSPQLYFVMVEDLNKKVIKVGYTSYEVTIKQLINNYLKITSCSEWIILPPCFKIIQHGPYYQQLAMNDDKLASYELNFDSPCFRVFADEVINQQAEKISKIRQQEQKQNIVPVKIQVQSLEYNFNIYLNQTLAELKQRLISHIQVLRKELPSNLYIMKDGLFIVDEKAFMKSYGITVNKNIRVNIMKKQGCFSKLTKIINKNNEEVLIGGLKVGDQILSYNEKSGQPQVDKVKYIHQSVVDQVAVVELVNGAVIQTTSNHLFLCEDGVYRSVDGQREDNSRLQVGSKLKMLDSVGQIISIQSRHLPIPETFYHLCIQNNHNFIANGVIVHNLFLNIVIPSGNTERVSIQPNQPFSKIKEYFEQQYELQIHNQQLFFAGKEIQNHQTMADRNIPKESNIQLKFRSSDTFNFLSPFTPILTAAGQTREICNIMEGHNIITLDSATKAPSKMGDIVATVSKTMVKEKIVIKLDSYDQQIVTSADCYLELENGEAMNVRDICYQYDHGAWPLIRRIDGKPYQIKQIVHEYLSKPIQFCKIILYTGENYVANNLIIHNLVVNILVFKNNRRERKLTLGANSTDRIIFLKQQVAKLTGMSVNSLEFRYDNKILDNEEDIASYNIRTEHIITANSLEKVSQSSLKITNPHAHNKENVKLSLQLSQNEKVIIDFAQYKNKTVEEIMHQMFPKYESSYFFVYAEIIIHPHEPLMKIKESKEEFADKATVIVVKNEKLAFIQNMSIQGSQVKNSSYIFSSHGNNASEISDASSRISVLRDDNLSKEFEAASGRIRSSEEITFGEFKTEKFYLPFLYLTSRQYNEKMLRHIRRFNKYRQYVNDNSSVYSIVKDLYMNMNMLGNYYGLCYFGMKNFKFSEFYVEQQMFYWHNFVVAYKESSNVQKDVSIDKDGNLLKGTLFIIESLTGKQIHLFSLHPQRKEVLFAPFTYFMVEKIQKGDKFDVVWLSEISSPITFQKDIVLWVDDQPKVNLNLIRSILKENDIEILQVTSTILAVKWVKQFGWLLNWKGLQFKLISDMTRIQKGVENKQAGVDLLQRLYKEHGISAETIVYCGNKENAEKNVKARNIPRQKFFRITIQEADVRIFCKMKNK